MRHAYISEVWCKFSIINRTDRPDILKKMHAQRKKKSLPGYVLEQLMIT